MVFEIADGGRWWKLGKLEVYLERTEVDYPILFDWVRYGPGDYVFLLFRHWRLFCSWRVLKDSRDSLGGGMGGPQAPTWDPASAC